MNVQVKQQNRKSMVMRLTPSGEVLVLIPSWLSPENRQVKQFIKKALKQIEPHIPGSTLPQTISEEEIRTLAYQWAERIGVEVGRVQLRTMYRKWGSCSSNGNITLNTALCWVPRHLAEYVIVHELVHLIVFDHSPAFWDKMEMVLPASRLLEQELQAYRV